MAEARAAIPRKRRKFSKPPGIRQTEAYRRAQELEVARPLSLEDRWLAIKRGVRNNPLYRMAEGYKDWWNDFIDKLDELGR